jgi:hypothetical protein
MAWRDFCFSPTGVRRLVELFGRFKSMQIGFVKAVKELQTILVPLPADFRGDQTQTSNGVAEN